MVKQGIRIFCRLKPTKSKTGLYEVDDEDNSNLPKLSFVVPRDLASGFINNKKEQYSFNFERIFDQRTKQDDIFDNIAKPVADSVLEGYNGTIFAYGQTGSGKTFTITGGPERYSDRGIIPRTLSYFFEQYQKNPDYKYSTHVSYLEIYNENGYDLLDPKHNVTKLEDLPKVSLMEDTDQNIHLKNLSIHPTNNEEDALNLLFLGDTNRMIAETPMNQASTRSHCIFTIHVSAHQVGSATIKRAKLHLVDLAGSERVSKTGVDGTLLTEAKYINLSLHYLEQVIVALAERSRQHIPYRNSMMTSVLRDSLGGNCMTTMIATCSVEKKNIDESISTCRFAQRVALIKNDAILNEELDPKLMIARLKREIQEMKDQLAIVSGEQSTEELTDEQIERLVELVRNYVEDSDPEATLNIGPDMRKINHCFRIFKKMVVKGGPVAKLSPQRSRSADLESRQQQQPIAADEPTDSVQHLKNADLKRLKDVIQQRDNEINILVNMLKKEKKRAQDAVHQMESMANNHATPPANAAAPIANGQSAGSDLRPHSGHRSGHRSKHRQAVEAAASLGDGQAGGQSLASSLTDQASSQSLASSSLTGQGKRSLLGDLSMGRREAFEIFRRDYAHNDAIEAKKRELKQLHKEAKSLGEQLIANREKVANLKKHVEQKRRQRLTIKELQKKMHEHGAQADMVGGDEIADEPDQTELEYIEARNRMSQIFGRLTELKKSVFPSLEHELEKRRLQLQKDFEIWWTEETARLRTKQEFDYDLPPPHRPSKAWKSPPVSPIITAGGESIKYQGTMNSTPSAHAGRPPSGHRHARDHHHHHHHHGDGGSSGPDKRSSSAAVTGTVGGASIALTGNSQYDDDIKAFMRARDHLLQRKN